MIYEKERRYIIPFDDVPSPRAHMPEISVDARRGNFEEVETGFSEDTALAEAKRCLSCRRCLGCALCWAECKPEAIDFSIPHEPMELAFDEVVLTRGQDNAFERLDGTLGYGAHAEVITDLQFERMLSPTGPTGGLVLSPKDGEIPTRLVFVQGAPRGGDEHLLSSLILGINEAILALHRTQGLQASLIGPQCAAFKERVLPEAEKIQGLKVIEASVIGVAQKGGEGPLGISYRSEAGEGEEAADIVVILTKPKISREIEALAKRLNRKVL